MYNYGKGSRQHAVSTFLSAIELASYGHVLSLQRDLFGGCADVLADSYSTRNWCVVLIYCEPSPALYGC